MGKYPVISISLKSTEQPNFGMAYSRLVEIISKEFNRHRELLNYECLYNDIKRTKDVYFNIGKVYCHIKM